MNNIEKGDRVEYVDTERRKGKTAKVPKFGTWDGEKVVLEDREKTTVRNKEWLIKHIHKYTQISGTWDEVCKCGEKRHFGFPLNACHSERQRECIVEDTGLPGGKMDPDSCYGCPHFH